VVVVYFKALQHFCIFGGGWEGGEEVMCAVNLLMCCFLSLSCIPLQQEYGVSTMKVDVPRCRLLPYLLNLTVSFLSKSLELSICYGHAYVYVSVVVCQCRIMYCILSILTTCFR
jgi:hypothetical protein